VVSLSSSKKWALQAFSSSPGAPGFSVENYEEEEEEEGTNSYFEFFVNWSLSANIIPFQRIPRTLKWKPVCDILKKRSGNGSGRLHFML